MTENRSARDMEIVSRVAMICKRRQVRGHEHVRTHFFKGLGFTVLSEVVIFFFKCSDLGIILKYPDLKMVLNWKYANGGSLETMPENTAPSSRRFP